MRYGHARRRAISIGAVAAAAAAAPAATEAAWELVPEFALTAESDDNVRFTPGEDDATSRAALDARLRLRNFGERGGAFIEPRIVAESYTGASLTGLENDDVHLITQADYAWEQVSIGWRSNFREQSILRSEFEAAIPDNVGIVDPIDTGVGTLGLLDQTRRRYDAVFDVDVSLSERTQLGIALEYIDVAYTSDADALFNPRAFEDKTLSATLSRAVDSRTDVSATVFVSEFTAVQNSNVTDTFGVEGAFSRPLSETWSLSLAASVQRLDYRFITSEGVPIDNADASFTFRVGVEKTSPRTRWSFEAGRLITPNSSGFRSERDQVRAFVRHEITPRLTGSAGIRRSELTADEAGFAAGRDYSRVALEIAWALTPRWSLTGGYDRIAENLGPADAVSDSVLVGIRYRGVPRDAE